MRVLFRRRLQDATTGEVIDLSFQEPQPSRSAWKCTFSLAGRAKRRGHAYGADPLQALTHAMESARRMLIEIGETVWDGLEGNGLPIYMPSLLMLGPAFKERVEALIAREEKRVLARYERRHKAQQRERDDRPDLSRPSNRRGKAKSPTRSNTRKPG